MKKYLFLLAIGILTACGNPNIIDFEIDAPGVTNATFIVNDGAGKGLFGGNIVNGKCRVKSSLEAEGFYTFDIVKNGSKSGHPPFEIFLEPGKYVVTVKDGRLGLYPLIDSKSRRQQEISDYNNLINVFGKKSMEEAARLNKELLTKGDGLSRDDFNALNRKLADENDRTREMGFLALEKFVKTNPNSEFAAHFMEQLNYQSDPVKFYNLYQQMGDAAKKSAEGKMISQRLSGLLNLMPGKPAPAIAGKIYDGKTFAQITAGKKIFVIDFWRAGNEVSRNNHADISDLYSQYKGKGLEVISVSIDSKADWWNAAVKADRLPWPQMADLKGDDSPNTLNWGVTKVPMYDLVTGDWKIIAMDVTLSGLQLGVSEYLEKHP